MNTELFVANELGALVAPLLALVCTLLASKQWKAKLLLFGQLAAFIFAVSGTALAMSQSVITPVFLEQGCLTLRLDLATSCLISGITFISAVVVAFSERYLSGERSRQKFLCYLSFLSSCAVCLAATDNLVVAFLCWHLLSVGLWRTMLLQDDGRDSAATVLRHHLLSDVAMLLALVLVCSSTGTVAFSQLSKVLPLLNSNLSLFGVSLPVTEGTAASLLLVLSFTIKSALFPFHRWLLATLDAPTPLSGFLHAGVVNVSAIMAWRMMPVLHENASVLLGWGCLSAFSAIVGTLSMSAQPDVKRKLVYSTVGQMGFMSLQCASGAIGAALFHLLAHGMFKCYMFLQSGSAVAEGLNKRKFGYASDQPQDRELRARVLIVGAALVFCAAVSVLVLNSGWTGLSAVITGAAIFCAVPALNRIDFKSLSFLWSTALAVALLSALVSSKFENLVMVVPTMTEWLLPLSLGVFGIVAIGLQLANKSSLAKALYVHSLNGFYIDDIAFATADRFRSKQNPL